MRGSAQVGIEPRRHARYEWLVRPAEKANERRGRMNSVVSTAIQDDVRFFHQRCMSKETLEALPEAVGIFRDDGLFTAHNEQYRNFWKLPQEHSLVGRFNLFTAPGVHPIDVQLLRNAIAGEHGVSPVIAIDVRDDPTFHEIQRKELWMQSSWVPLRVDGKVRFIMARFLDCTQDMLNKQRIEENAAQLAAQQTTIEELRTAHDQIRRQQDTIRELSMPIIEVWPGVLTIPVMGHVDERRASEMTERLLTSLVTHRAQHAIIDLTGVERLDEMTLSHVLQMLRAVPLLGVQPVITGIHPNVAQSIITLGLDMQSIRTVGTLRSALAEIIDQRAPDNARHERPGTKSNKVNPKHRL